MAAEVDLAAVAARCAQALDRRQRINIGSGVYTEQAVVAAPLEIEIPLATDAERYADCLVREGVDGGARLAAFVEQTVQCREQARQAELRVGRAGESVRLRGVYDEAALRGCLGGAISVEVLPDER